MLTPVTRIYMHRRDTFQFKRADYINKSSNPSKGFSFAELLLAISIVGILAAISIPAYSGYIQKARNIRCIAEIKQIESVINAFHNDFEIFPKNLSLIRSDMSSDPWGHPYKYLLIEGKGKGACRRDRFLNPLNADYDLYSMGADGLSSTQLNSSKSRDDIVRANNGFFIGLASDF